MDNIVVKNKSKEYCLNVIKPFFEANGIRCGSFIDDTADKGGYVGIETGDLFWVSHCYDPKNTLINLPEPPKHEYPKEMMCGDNENELRPLLVLTDLGSDYVYRYVCVDTKLHAFNKEQDDYDTVPYKIAKDIEPERPQKKLSEILKEYASDKYPGCEIIDDLKSKNVRVR